MGNINSSNYVNEIDNLNSNIQMLEKRLICYQTSNDTYKEESINLKKNIENLNLKYKNMESDKNNNILILQNKYDTVCIEYENKINLYKKEIDELKNSNNRDDKEIDLLSIDNEELKYNNEILNEENEKLKSKLEYIKIKSEEIEIENKNITISNNIFQNENNLLKNEQISLNEKNNSLIESNELLKKEIEQLNNNNNQNKLNINNLEEQIKSNNRLIETLKEENNTFNINSKELIDKTKNFELVKTELVTINNKIIDLPSKLKEIYQNNKKKFINDILNEHNTILPDNYETKIIENATNELTDKYIQFIEQYLNKI